LFGTARWAGYVLAPHHYVTFCLVRPCIARGSLGGKILCLLLLTAQCSGDCASLALLVLLLRQPAPPVALAFGFWLSAAGIVAFFGVMSVYMLKHDDHSPGTLLLIFWLLGLISVALAVIVAALLLVATPAKLWFGKCTLCALGIHAE
jgi:hypothetical protein